MLIQLLKSEDEDAPLKAAIPVWNGRIAPVFDVARRVCLVEAQSGQMVTENEILLPDGEPRAKLLRLMELGTEVLICGAISRPIQTMATAYGIQLIPFVAGELDVIKNAWLSGTPLPERFAMPGCCGCGQRRFRRRGCG